MWPRAGFRGKFGTSFRSAYIERSKTYPFPRGLAGPEIVDLGGLNGPLLPQNFTFGRPEGLFRCLPGSSPAKIRPGRPISGPEALLRSIE